MKPKLSCILQELEIGCGAGDSEADFQKNLLDSGKACPGTEFERLPPLAQAGFADTISRSAQWVRSFSIGE